MIAWPYSAAELWTDGAVHVCGILLTITGCVALGVAISGGGLVPGITAAVYSTTLLFSITSSAAYNIWPVSRAKWIMRRLDHAAIYFLIAGTYTLVLAQIQSWILIGTIWVIAFAGAAIKIFWPGRFDKLSILLYLALGWSGISNLEQLLERLPSSSFWLLVTGGIIYSVGVIFHLSEQLRFHNAIWHGFVLAAAAVHYFAILRLVTP